MTDESIPRGEILRVSGPLVVCVLIAAIVASTLALADNSATAARAEQERGDTRGSILDRNGVPLSWTRVVGGHPVREQAAGGLSTAIGFRAPDGRWHGLERRYDGVLTASKARKDWKSFFLNLRGQPVRGGMVKTTLDMHLQQVAARALGKAKGAVVAVEPQTGAVRAFVSSPSCSAEQLSTVRGYRACQSNASRPLLRRASEILLPPGSAFKIVTLSAALDTGTFSLQSVFSGADAFGPSPYFDNSTYPSNVTRSDLTQLTLAQALAFSDNFTFAHIGLTLGARTLLSYAHRFYVGRRIPFEYPVKVSTIADGRSRPSLSEVARSSFGAPTDRVTPMQMAAIVSTVANKGVLMAPHLVAGLEDASGHDTYRFEPHALGRVMSRHAAREVTKGMEFVVQHGSGYLAQVPHVAVAGKTGTAASGAYFPHAWFNSFAPADHPVIAVAVLHEFSGEGFKYAAPIARKVMVAALQERGFHVH
jgi:peptidoglycan glycosyltransferase